MAEQDLKHVNVRKKNGTVYRRRKPKPKHGHTIDNNYSPTYQSWQSMIAHGC